MNEKELLKTLDPLITALASMQKQLNLLEQKPGPKGEDADPEVVAEILAKEYLDFLKGEPGKDADAVDVDALAAQLVDDPVFQKLCKGDPGEDGESISIEAVADLVIEKYADQLKGEPGESPVVHLQQLCDELCEREDFLHKIKGEPGESVDPETVADLVYEKYADRLKGVDGETPEVEINSVRDALLESKVFTTLTKGEKGKDADPEEVAKILIKDYRDILKGEKGEDGNTPEITLEDVRDTLLESSDFLALVKGADGRDADSKEVAKHIFDLYKAELKGDKGDQGEPGAPGKDVDSDQVIQALKADTAFLCAIKGEPGPVGETPPGITAPQWKEGVYLKDAIVQHELGRFYCAVTNTASEPGTTPEWERVGTLGFAWKSVKKEGAVYEDGDLYIDNGTTFLWWKGKGHMFAKRGRDGKDGERGAKGDPGEAAPQFVGGAFSVNTLSLVLSNGEVLDCEIKGTQELIQRTVDDSIEEAFHTVRKELEKRGVPFGVYRGEWKSGTGYKVGDCFKYNLGLYIVIKPFSGTVLSDEYVERLTGSASSGASVSQKVINQLVNNALTQYGGLLYWDADYEVNDAVVKGTIVNDSGWLMVANKDTSDPAAPQAFGAPTLYGVGLPTDDTGWTSKTNEDLRFLWVGAQYNLDFNYIITHIYFYIAEVSTDISYDIFIVDMTGGKNKYVPISTNYPAQTTGWHAIPTGQIVVPANSLLSVVLQKTSAASSVTASGTWNYHRSDSLPTIGRINHSATDATLLRVSQQDSALADRSALLDLAVSGSTISAGGVVWDVTGMTFIPGTSNDGYYEFTISPTTRLTNNSSYTFTFTTYATYSLPIWSVPNFYASDPLVQGLIRKDDNAIVYNEDAYSVDILFQPVSISPDWDIMSASDTVATNSAPDAQQLPLAAGGQALPQSIAATQAATTSISAQVPVPGASPGDNLLNEFIPMPPDGAFHVLDFVGWNTKRNFHPVMSAYLSDKTTPAPQLSAQMITLGAHDFTAGTTYTWDVSGMMQTGTPSFFLSDEPVYVDTKVIARFEIDRRNPDFDVMRFTTNFVSVSGNYHECHSLVTVNKADSAAYLQFIEVPTQPGTEWRAFTL